MQIWDARVAAEKITQVIRFIACQPFQVVSRLVNSYEGSISPNAQHIRTPPIKSSKMPRQGTNQEYIYFQES